MRRDKMKLIYHGSANHFPRYGITLKGDGTVIDLPEEQAKELIAENIGFAPEEKKTKDKKGEEK